MEVGVGEGQRERERERERERTLSLPLPLTATSTKSFNLEWVPLSNHPVFLDHHRNSTKTTTATSSEPQPARFGINRGNLAVWDSVSSRLYLWDTDGKRLHRLSVRFGDPDDSDGTPSIQAACPSEVFLMDISTDSDIQHISLNRECSVMLLLGSDGLFIMYVFDRVRVSSDDDSIICRTISLGSNEMYFGKNNGLRIIQASWHPYSRTHIGILSSDMVFRLYDLSSDFNKPEQEYYLEVIESNRYRNMTSSCPMAFSFGGEHLWDRFTVFILFSDGLIYILCPVVPFGSIFTWDCLVEIYEDANVFGLKSLNKKAVSNSWFAVNWLEATFPELPNKSTTMDNMPDGLISRPYSPMDASLTLQGPLRAFSYPPNEIPHDTDFNGWAVGLLYNLIGKDSILVIAWTNGQLQIEALADEVQPVWNTNTSPRLHVDSHGHTTRISMICESLYHSNHEISGVVWLGYPPSLLTLSTVDLTLSNTTISLYSDPSVPERIFCVHNEGIDSIILQFLPFSNSNSTTNETKPMKPTTVYPILDGCNGVYGFIAIMDSFGNSQVICITPLYDCFILDLKRWNQPLLLPIDIITNSKFSSLSNTGVLKLINGEILTGPKGVIVPESSSLLDLRVDSTEGQSALHRYTKLFQKHYANYAHKVYFELKQHGNHLKTILDEHHTRLQDANFILSNVEARHTSIHKRVNAAIQGFMILEQRLHNLRNLPGMKRKCLSKSEREFKNQLDRFASFELDAFHSSIESMNKRARRYIYSTRSSPTTSSRANLNYIDTKRRNQMMSLDNCADQLKLSLEKLSLVNSENSIKVKAIERALQKHEIDQK